MQKVNKSQKMNISQMREKIKQVFDDVFGQPDKRIIVEKSGIPVGAVISMMDLNRLIELDKKRERFFKLTDEMSKKFEGVSEDEILEEAVKATKKVRRQIWEENKHSHKK